MEDRAISALTGNWGLDCGYYLGLWTGDEWPTLPYRIMESVASSSFSLIAVVAFAIGLQLYRPFLDVDSWNKAGFCPSFRWVLKTMDGYWVQC